MKSRVTRYVITKCEITGEEFETPRQFLYHLKKLKITEKEYFDKFLKQDNDEICKTCGNSVDFQNIRCGYKLYCSHKCALNHPDEKIKRAESVKQICLEKYGVEYISQLPEIVQKTKQTKLEKYGDENYNNQKKIQSTLLEKYGVAYSAHVPGVREKIKKTSLEKYGTEHPSQNENVKQKVRETTFQKYGSFHFNQSERGKEVLKNYWESLSDDDWKVILEARKEGSLEKYGTEFPMQSEEIRSRTRDSSLKVAYEDYLERFNHVKFLFTFDEYKGSKFYYKFECQTCGHTFEDTFGSGKIPRCDVCIPYTNSSQPEYDIKSLIESKGFEVIHRKRIEGTRYEIDLFVPALNLGIEYNGLKWHSEQYKPNRQYHKKKTELCEERNIRLIQIFEDEWLNKRHLVEKKLLHILKCDYPRIYARTCVVREIDSKLSNKFLNVHHIQGVDKSKVRFGAFHNDELVAVMTFHSLRKSLGQVTKENHWELVRFATNNDFIVVGIFGRLLKTFIKQYSPSNIITYADRRWSSRLGQTIYSKYGFTEVSVGNPGYFYIKNEIRYHRYGFRKQILENKLEKYDSNLSEVENMKQNGYDRLFDCGHIKYELVCDKENRPMGNSDAERMEIIRGCAVV